VLSTIFCPRGEKFPVFSSITRKRFWLVIKKPGAIAFTRIPTFARCTASHSVKLFTDAFVLKAEALQASAIICESPQKVNIPQVVVANTQEALAKLGHANRKNNKAKIIAVTGSNGKTTVKEMIAAILGEVGPTLATIGNLNNDIGVPLTLLRLDQADDFGVIEMGANNPEEIAYLSQCAEPDVGVITNIAEAHLEGFESLEGVAKTKCELLESLSKTGIAVLNKDDAFFDFCVERAGSSRVISFGLSALADVSPIAIKSQLREGQFMTRFTIKYQQELFDVRVGLVGDHNIKLSYNVPIAKNILSNLTFYLSASNLITITNYSGYDPEVNSFSNINQYIGVDGAAYPSSRTFTFGVNVSF